MNIGDRVSLWGGYDMHPAGLAGGTGYTGEMIAFIPGQNDEPAAVVRLDQRITVEGAEGQIVVLELRYVGQKWESRGTVHIELCDFVPEPKRWQDRRQGKWVESHARYEVLAG